ncbi:MAG TPA: alpha-amylase family glycosyl hydrolase [Bryobacteraceae bacterium]|nr:alpha-amylase family glycosyl hydrolase [Bryobacteraceae bacterium]
MFRPTRITSILFASLAFLTFTRTSFAQWNTPNVDGIIESAEYGNTANGTNQIGTSTAQTWYMTWDATNLYVGITNANLSEAAVIYVGTGGGGTTSGENYDGTSFSSLPFPAQFVTYFKDGYNEYRTSTGGNWSSPTSNAVTYASNSSSGPNTREIAIPWSAITGGGIPAQFNFFGYLTSSGGYVYGQVPNDNPGTTIGASATYTQYYSVTNTGNGASTPPFSNEQPSGFGSADRAGFYHNTFDPFYRSSEGAVPEGTQVTLRFRTLHSTGAYGVNLRVYALATGTGVTTGPTDTNMPFEQNITINETEYDVWKVMVTMPSSPTVYYYKFNIYNANTNGWYSDDYVDDYDNLNKDGTGAAYNAEPFDSFQITVYDPDFQTPSWMSTANIYHIFPDRFRNGDPTNDYCVQGSTSGCPLFYGQNSIIPITTWNSPICDPYNSSGTCYNDFSNDFHGGDLLGIQNELDYIQGLGFDTLYLNPIFTASSNHRYDTDDYFNVDPALGGNTAFNNLVAELQHRGMNIVLDGVWNHASSDSQYFNEYQRYGVGVGACESDSSPYRSWFNFNSGDTNAPCNTNDYVGWDGVNTLPTFNHNNTTVQNFFYGSGYNGNASVMQNWYNLGATGWRFDAADDGNFPHQWWVGTRQAGKTYNSNAPLLGEIWPNASAYLAGDQMDGVMNYRFRRNVSGFARGQYNWCDNNDNGNDCIISLTPSQFDTAMRAIRDDYPLPATFSMMNLIDSHDTNRALYILTEEGDSGLDRAKQRLELAALFQFTYIGAPMVMYGDEVAINSPSLYSGSSGPVGDPYTRAPYPWTDQPGNVNTYGPPDTTVESFYTKLGHLRKQYPALSSGTFAALLTGDTQQPSTAPNTYAYARVGSNQTAVVVLNNGSTTNTPSIPVAGYFSDGTTLVDVLSGNTYDVTGGTVSLSLPAISGALLLPSPASVDLTPPTGMISLLPTPNANGWINSSPVSANISATDGSGSGINQIRNWVDNGNVSSTTSSPASASVSGEGKHTVNARAIDNAGNISSLISANANIDLTPPVVTVTGVTNNGTYAYEAAPTPGCQTVDTLSGVATNATVQVTGDNGEGYGNFTATCSGATDNAGNAAQPVVVSYSVQAPPNITNSVRMISTGLVYDKATKTGTETLMVMNASGAAIPGPIQVVISNLPQGVTVVGPTGTWGGNPYVTVTGSTLAPDETVTISLTFSFAMEKKVTATLTAYTGALRN